MAYVRFMNGANPLWDFISEISAQEPQSNEHPFPPRHHRGPPRPGSWGWSPFDGGDDRPEHGPWSREMPHRPHHPHPRHGRGPRGHHHGPPPPPGAGDHPPPPPPDYSEDDEARSATVQAEDGPIDLIDNANADSKDPVPDPEISTPNDNDDEETAAENRHAEAFSRHCNRGRYWQRERGQAPFDFGHGGSFFGRRGGWGGHGRGGMRGHWGMGGPGAHPRHRHPYGHPHHRRRGSGPPPPPPGAGNPVAYWSNLFGIDPANFDTERVREMFAEALHTAATSVHPNGGRAGGGNADNDDEEDNSKTINKSKDVDFTPAADIYDATSEYVVHFALPGAKKEDISLNWDAEKSELNIAGVIARDGDEEVMKTLALDERDVGVFERKVKLGREGVDAEGITAKMENGLLVVRVPKKVEDEWTEVRQVDIE